jgi:hydroxymethylpyrimidine/phosphomethylpyrimidine kinase
MIDVALTVAGSDPSGGAGLQADLKTFHQHGVYGAAVVTLVTVQNTRGVARVVPLDAALVGEQLDAVLDDVPPRAWKTGALGSRAVVEAVAERAARFARRGVPLVVDPVMISKHGAPLIDDDARGALVRALLPHCALVTPNVHEAEALAGFAVRTLADAGRAAEAIAAKGPRAVLVKGGHLEGAPTDLLFDGHSLHALPGERIDTPHTHGTGCTLSAAITARLAQGATLRDACAGAKQWLGDALRTAPGVGGGIGPVNHLAPLVSGASRGGRASPG